jgi:30S ribosome assembly GTPase
LLEQAITCTGCGVSIQTEDKKGLGYAPPSTLNKEIIICQRCFRLKHYNELHPVSLTDDDFLEILNGIGKTDSLVVKIVDIFDFHGSWLPGLHRFVGNNDIILVGNKVDLLPKSANQNRLKNWMQQSAKELGMNPKEIALISAAKGHNIDELAGIIDQYREGKDVYIVGCTNVGKSTFINRLIKQFGGETEETITTSHFPGTTLDLIDIPLGDDATLYDTPGIINHHQMAHFIDEKELKVITPKSEIKPMVFQLNEQQTLYFGGLARLDYLSGGRRSFVAFMANNLPIHRTKLEKADDLYEKHVGEMLSPPGPESLKNFPKFVKHSFSLKQEKTDIVFSGLGWVTVHDLGAQVEVHAPKGVSVTVRPSLI